MSVLAISTLVTVFREEATKSIKTTQNSKGGENDKNAECLGTNLAISWLNCQRDFYKSFRQV